MVTVWVDRSINRIKLQTDDPSTRFFLECTHWVTKFNPFRKKMEPRAVTEKIYDETRVTAHNGIYTFTLGLGWAAYIANTFKGFISQEDFDALVSVIIADTYRDTPFTELRDYQNEDVLHILKYKIGLFGCYTSYG